MRNSTSVMRRLLLCFFVLAASMSYAQTPNSIGTDISDGTYINVNFTTVSALFSQYRVQATVSAAYAVRKLEFPIAVGDYSTVWRAYVALGDTLSGFNTMIDPVTQTASARYNSGFGGTGIMLPAITAGNYYTINVTTDHGNADDTMSVLETTYSPVAVTSISIPYDTNAVGPACSPTIVATLSAAPSVGEYVYLRYSTTGFQDSSIVIPMVVSGSTATAQIPAYPASVHIDYYVLTSPNPSLITTGPGSGYYDSYTLNLQNGTAGNNFRYTVKTLPVPAVSVAATQTTICQGMVDSFTAHTSNTDTAVTIFQWYKNGAPVGSNDSIYTDATLNNNDSVWVIVTVDFGCPVNDTSAHTIITVNPLPTGTALASPSAICFGDTSFAIASPSDPTDSTGWYDLSSGGTFLGGGDSLMVLPATPGQDTVYTQLISAAGCSAARIPVAITVYPLATYTQNDTFCNSGSVTVGSTTHNGPGTYVDTLFNSSVNGCDSIVTTTIVINTSVPFSQTDTICSGGTFMVGPYSHNANGTYVDTLFGASLMGCDSIVTTNLTVVPQPVSGTLTRNPNNNRVCDGAMVSATATAGSGGFDSSMDVLQYSFDSGPWQPYISGTLLNTTGYNSLYIETFRTSSGTDCDTSVADTVSWIIVKQPVSGNLHNMPHDTSLCEGDSVVANPGPGSGGAGVVTDTTQYSLDGGPWMPYVAGTYIYSTGHTTISIQTFRTTTGTGCTQSTPNEVTYTVNPYPTNNIGTGPITQCGGHVILDAGNPGSTYQWTDGSTNEIDTISTSGQLTVTVTNAAGCTASFGRHANIKPVAVLDLGPDRTLCADSTTLDAGDPGFAYIWTGGDTTEFLTAYTSGTYTVTVTDTASGCATSDSVQLTFNTPPAVHLSNDTSSCGGTITLDAGNPGDTYLWSNGSTGQTLTVSSSGIYSVTVTGGGCSGSGSGFVNIYPIPNLGPDVSDSVCPGSSADLYDYFNGSGLMLTYSTPTPASVDTGTYTVVGTNSNGCSDTAYVRITYRIKPTLGVDQTDSVCSGFGLDLTQIYPDSGYTAYSWNTPDPQNAGAGTYQLIVTNASGCTDTAIATLVNFVPAPVIGLQSDTIQCGGTVTLSVFQVKSSYLWSTGDTSSQITVSSTGTYSVTVTNINGCTASASEMVTIYPQPNLGPDVQDSICPGSTADLYNYFINSGLAMTYSSPTPASVDTGTYMIIGTNSNGCSDTAYVTITLRSKPNLGGNKTDSICAGYTYNLTTLYPDSGYVSYVWNVSNDTAVTAGTYQLIVTNASGCTDTATATITLRQQPVVAIPSYGNQCITNPAFTMTGATPAGGTYYINYVADSIFNPSGLGAGIYHVLYIYTNASGCTDSASENINVWPQPLITDTIGLPSVCTGSPLIDLNNYFSPPGGVFSGPGVSGSIFYPSLVPVGSDSITYIITSQNGCMDTAGQRIDIIPAVKVSLHTTQSNFTICAGQPITFTASGAEFYQFFVNDSAQGPADTTNTFTTTTLANHAQVSVVGSNACSSDTSDYIIIDVITPPVVSAGPDTTIVLGQDVQLYTNATGASSLVYIWTPDSFLNVATIPNPVYSGPDTITFVVKVTDVYGCSDTALVTINVQIPDNIQLPNVITPNSDGKNDVWLLNEKIDLTGSHLVILNRWGELVYETYNYANNWGGTYKDSGKKLPDDTYYYVLTVPAQDNHTYKGAINILSSSGN